MGVVFCRKRLEMGRFSWPSCRRHGITPHDYLYEALGKLPAMTNQDNVIRIGVVSGESDVLK